jgi:tight adherence protein B
MGAAILIFLIFTGATAAACEYAIWGPERRAAEAAERRLRGLRAERVQRRAGPLLKERSLSSVGFLHQIYSRLQIMHQLQAILEQAAMPYKAGALLSLGVIVAGLTIVLSEVGHIFPIRTLEILFALGLGLVPVYYVWWRREKRMARIEESLPECIDLFTRAMKAGHNIHSGIEVLSKEASEPIAGEFKKVQEELTLGSTVELALHNLGDRVPLLDMRFFSTGLILQRETGANLVTVLENLSTVIRERLQLRAKLRSHTAQQRFSAALLCGLPVLTLAVFYFVKYDYVAVLWTTELGSKFFTYALISELLGIFVIRRISAIKM